MSDGYDESCWDVTDGGGEVAAEEYDGSGYGDPSEGGDAVGDGTGCGGLDEYADEEYGEEYGEEYADEDDVVTTSYADAGSTPPDPAPAEVTHAATGADRIAARADVVPPVPVAAPTAAAYAPQPEVVDVDASGTPTHVRYTEPIQTNAVTTVAMGGNQTVPAGVPDASHTVSSVPMAPASTDFYGTTVGGQVRVPSASDYATPGSAAASGGLGIVDASTVAADIAHRTITGTSPNREADGSIGSYSTSDGSDFRNLGDALDYQGQYERGVKRPYAGPELDR